MASRQCQWLLCSAQTTAAMISLSFVTVITGFYAMNLRNGPWQPNGYQHDYSTFYEVSITDCQVLALCRSL